MTTEAEPQAGDEPATAGAAAGAAAGGAGRGAPGRGRRAGVLLTALLAVATADTWLTPFVAPGDRGVPFGCGSLAHPQGATLARAVCAGQSDGQVVRLVALLVAMAVAGAASRWLVHRADVLAGVLAAVPVLVVGTVLLLSPVAVHGSEGQPIACGRPVAPTGDRLAQGLCADEPAHRLGVGIGLVVAGLVLAAGVPWAAAPGRRRRP